MWILYSTSLPNFESILTKHPLIAAVSVQFSANFTTVCSTGSGNVVQIEFTQDFGPLPPLVPSLDMTMQSNGGTVIASGISLSL